MSPKIFVGSVICESEPVDEEMKTALIKASKLVPPLLETSSNHWEGKSEP